jgi:hypothetical protein
MPGLEVRVLDYDDRLLLENKTGKTIVVLGYGGEPYVGLRPDAAYRNRRSPATYLNEERFGTTCSTGPTRCKRAVKRSRSGEVWTTPSAGESIQSVAGRSARRARTRRRKQRGGGAAAAWARESLGGIDALR